MDTLPAELVNIIFGEILGDLPTSGYTVCGEGTNSPPYRPGFDNRKFMDLQARWGG